MKEEERKTNLENDIIGGGVTVEQRMNPKILNREVQHVSEKD